MPVLWKTKSTFSTRTLDAQRTRAHRIRRHYPFWKRGQNLRSDFSWHPFRNQLAQGLCRAAPRRRFHAGFPEQLGARGCAVATRATSPAPAQGNAFAERTASRTRTRSGTSWHKGCAMLRWDNASAGAGVRVQALVRRCAAHPLCHPVSGQNACVKARSPCRLSPANAPDNRGSASAASRSSGTRRTRR